jgi:hypothetical protein
MESRLKSVAVAVNTGVVTSYRADGSFRWQVDGAPTWSLEFAHAYAGLIDVDAERAHELGGADKLKSNILVIGERSFSMLSTSGDILTTSELPNSPITRPSFGDFDNDGITDLILYTSDAILGYRLVRTESTKIMFVTLMILTVVAIFCFIMNIRTNPSSTQEDSANGSSLSNTANILKAKYKKNVLALMRSTDDYHIE